MCIVNHMTTITTRVGVPIMGHRVIIKRRGRAGREEKINYHCHENCDQEETSCFHCSPPLFEVNCFRLREDFFGDTKSFPNIFCLSVLIGLEGDTFQRRKKKACCHATVRRNPFQLLGSEKVPRIYSEFMWVLAQ